MSADPQIVELQASDIFGKTPLSSVQLTDRPALTSMLAQAGLLDLAKLSHAEDLRDALERLKADVMAAHLDTVDASTIVKLVLDHLDRAKIANARPMVKAVLGDLTPKAAAGKREDAPHANAVTISDDEPGDGPVDADAVLDATSTLIRQHMVLNPAQADAIALWVAAAYVIDALVLMPILLITAPTMRSGKTTLLTLLAAIVPRALAASNITGAVLARAIAAFNPTLLADEADTWLTDEASELRGIMNAGHTRPTAYILRCAPDTHEPTLIPCFGARVLSMIRRPPSTIADRAIAIDLRRKRADEQVVRLRVDRLHAEHLPLRRLYRRWALDHLDAIRDTDATVPAGLHDRAADNWRPLLAIADLIGGEWPARARAAAVALSGEDDPDDSISIELLQDIRTIFAGRSGKWISSADLTAALVATPDRPWAEWSGGRPMTPAKLAARLKPFGLKPHKIRDGAKTHNAYATADFEDILSRYLPIEPEQPEQLNVSGPCSDFYDSEQSRNVPTSDRNTAAVSGGCSGFKPERSECVPTSTTWNNSMFIESVPAVPVSKPDLGTEKKNTLEAEVVTDADI